MQIGILGAGNIGGTLGKKLTNAGHEVLYGVRDPASPKALAAQVEGAQFGTFEAAVRFGEVVIVSLPMLAAYELLPTLNLTGKLVVDTTNAFQPAPDGHPSAGSAIASVAKGARIVKAWNATPREALENPVYQGMTVETYICGDDNAAKDMVRPLVEQTGFIVVDVGGLANAVLTENFARIWGAVAFQAGAGRDVAFKLVRR